MKKKIFLMLFIISMLACLFALSVSAAVTTYDDAPVRTNIVVSTDDVVVFDDGFSCPTGYVFKDVTEISNGGHNSPTAKNAFDFSYVNEKTGKNYNFTNIVSLDLPQGLEYVGGYAMHKATHLKKVSFPNTVTGLGMAVFQDCTGLEECVFEHDENSTLETFPGWFFGYCSSLKAISFPDCIKYFGDSKSNSYFIGCSSITAIYLPKKLEKAYGGSNGGAVFGQLPSAYFVNEPFTYDNIPAKPDVYYFPENLETITGETFDTCKNLNSVLVFGKKLTSVENGWTFENVMAGEGKKPTVVFLGDATKMVVTSWNVQAIYFCNENDVDATSAGVSGNKTIYYCNAQGNTNHLAEKTVDVPAKCEIDAGKVTYCFCGHEISKVPVEGTALEHNLDYVNGGATLVSVTYADLSKNGTKVVKCSLCQADKELSADKVFDYKGYSKNDKGGFCMGYIVNQNALKDYESKNGKVNYGFVASANNNAPLNADGTAKENVVKADLTSSDYTSVDFILTAEDWTKESVATAKISLNMYVIVNNTFKYITANGYSDTAEAYTYSEIQ